MVLLSLFYVLKLPSTLILIDHWNFQNSKCSKFIPLPSFLVCMSLFHLSWWRCHSSIFLGVYVTLPSFLVLCHSSIFLGVMSLFHLSWWVCHSSIIFGGYVTLPSFLVEDVFFRRKYACYILRLNWSVNGMSNFYRFYTEIFFGWFSSAQITNYKSFFVHLPILMRTTREAN